MGSPWRRMKSQLRQSRYREKDEEDPLSVSLSLFHVDDDASRPWRAIPSSMCNHYHSIEAVLPDLHVLLECSSWMYNTGDASTESFVQQENARFGIRVYSWKRAEKSVFTKSVNSEIMIWYVVRNRRQPCDGGRLKVYHDLDFFVAGGRMVSARARTFCRDFRKAPIRRRTSDASFAVYLPLYLIFANEYQSVMNAPSITYQNDK